MDPTLCLAFAIYLEARGEPPACRHAVAEVVIERTLSPRYPDDVCGVVFQRKQFSAFNDDGWSKRIDKHSDAWRDALAVADAYTRGYPDIPLYNDADFSGGADHYFAFELVDPAWASSMTPVATCGGHRFLTSTR